MSAADTARAGGGGAGSRSAWAAPTIRTGRPGGCSACTAHRIGDCAGASLARRLTRMTRHKSLRSLCAACALALLAFSARAEVPLTPAEARMIAKDAYIYGFPIVDSYRIQYAYSVDRSSPEFKAPWNQLTNIPRVYTPADKAVQTPNSDTPYSFVGLDLRAEPMVLTVPAIEKSRYFSVQLIDLYTQNFAYIGSRATGNGGGSYLIAGPEWKGETPTGIAAVIPSETELVLAVYRTQLFGPDDLDNVKKVQAGYRAEPLSQFASLPPPAPAPQIDFVAPLTPEQEMSSPRFFEVLNFVLGFCPTVPSEQALMTRFSRLNIGP